MVHMPYDPATHHGAVVYGPVFGCTEPCCAGATPGGNHTITWANEKSVQEWNNVNVMKRHTEAALGSDHDAYAQGIYTTHHFGSDVYGTED
jgi:hypothetical protein